MSRSLILHNLKLETDRISISRWTHKKITGIHKMNYYSAVKKNGTHTQDIDESHRCDAERKKLGAEEYCMTPCTQCSRSGKTKFWLNKQLNQLLLKVGMDWERVWGNFEG